MAVFQMLDHPAVLLCASVFVCMSLFYQLLQMVQVKKLGSFWILLLLSLFNSIGVLVVDALFSYNGSSLIVAVLPAVTILELVLISRDTVWAYVNYYFIILQIYLCCFGMVSAASFFLRIEFLGTAEAGLHHLRLVFSMVFIGLMSTLAVRSKRFEMGRITELLHDKKRSVFLLIYSICADVVLLFSIVHVVSLTDRALLSREVAIVTALNLLLNDGLILTSNFLIQIFLIRLRTSKAETIRVTHTLEHEKSFRKNLHADAVFSYCANISKDRLEDGLENIQPDILAAYDCYSSILKSFLVMCVHPEDREQITNIGSEEYYVDMLRNRPSYNVYMRVLPGGLMDFINLRGKVKETIENASWDWIWMDFQVTIAQDPEDGDIRAYVSLTDVNERILEENALLESANKDSLTGIYNRSALERHIADALKQDERGVMFMIDLDHFKEVNDTMGHQAGDALLREIADTICSVFRDGDIIGRMGGDEFCVYAPNLESMQIIRQRAAMLNEKCQRIFMLEDGGKIQTSLSIGIAVAPTDGGSYEELYRNADLALYQAKEAGRNTYRLYAQDIAAGLTQ